MITTPLQHAVRRGWLCLLVVGLATVAAPSATAATPCGEAVILDWSDGTIDRVYSAACYRDALRRLPEDLRAYSTAPEDIERALLALARADGPGTEPQEAPRSLAGPTQTPTTTEEDAPPAPAETQPPAGSGSDATGEAVAAPVTVEPADSDRTPVLAIAALVLLAAGAAIPLVRALAARRRAH
jgi:hypothetical protein